MITIILIYFVGCLFYFGVRQLNSDEDWHSEDHANTFEFYFTGIESNFNQVTILLYFSMTTVAKIGYGDYYPQSDVEKIMTIMILFISMVFFSYVLEQFINILQKDPSPSAVI